MLVDDRDQRPGVKFKDADLIGVPLRVVIGERGPEGRDDRGEVADRPRRAQRLDRVGFDEIDPGRVGDDPPKGMETKATERRGSPGPRRGANDPSNATGKAPPPAVRPPGR